MRRTVAVVLAAAGALGGCSSAGANAALNEPLIDTLPGGVVQIQNTGPTRWADTVGWRLVPVTVIAPAEGSAGELSEISSLVADAAGNTYVLQREPAMIKVYGPDGTWLRDIGREGDGPGEFRSGMFTIVGDTLAVQDPNNSRLTTFLTDGTFLSSHVSQCCYWMSNFPTFDDGLIGIPGPPPPGGGERVAYYLTNTRGVVQDTMLLPESRDEDGPSWSVTRTSNGGRSTMSMNVPLQPQSLSEFRPDRKVIRGNTGQYRLVIGNDHTDSIRVFTAPGSPLPITEIERDSIYEESVAEVGEQWSDAVREVAKKSDIPGVRPPWTGFALDGMGRIWVSRPAAGTDVATLDVFDAEGILLGSVPAPHRNILNGYWTGNQVHLRDESEDGLPIVRVFRIDTTVKQ
jgi:hypothetical protein